MKAEYGMSIEVSPNNWKKMNLFLDAKDGETPHQLMDRVEDEVESWFAKRLPRSSSSIMESALQNAARPMEIKVENQPREERIKLLMEDMKKCTTLPKPDGLESYRTFALQYPETTLLYNELHEKLIMTP